MIAYSANAPASEYAAPVAMTDDYITLEKTAVIIVKAGSVAVITIANCQPL